MSERTENAEGVGPAGDRSTVTFSQRLGRTVRSRRKDLGLTQIDLGLLAHVSPSFLNDLEAGKPSVALDRVVQVLDVLGVEIALTLRMSSRETWG